MVAVAIALYASTDSGATWAFENIIATGGWSNGYSYPATEDTYHENDPVWEPYLMVYNGQIVTLGEDFSIQYDDLLPGLGYPP